MAVQIQCFLKYIDTYTNHYMIMMFLLQLHYLSQCFVLSGLGKRCTWGSSQRCHGKIFGHLFFTGWYIARWESTRLSDCRGSRMLWGFNWGRWRCTSNRGCCCYWYRFPKRKRVITQYVFRARKNTDIEFRALLRCLGGTSPLKKSEPLIFRRY